MEDAAAGAGTNLLGLSKNVPNIDKNVDAARVVACATRTRSVYSLAQSSASPNFAPVIDGSIFFSRPVSTPPAPTSMQRVTPFDARRRMVFTHCTGFGTC